MHKKVSWRKGSEERNHKPVGYGRDGSGYHSAKSFVYCVCPNCGMKMLHQLGMPCNRQRCSFCGIPMARG